MQILLIEDDENKRKRLDSFIHERYPESEVLHSSSLVSGLQTAKRADPDAIILDMTLPNYDGPTDGSGNPMRKFGGQEFIRQAHRRKINGKIVVVTQFESFGEPPEVTTLADLDKRLSQDFSDHYLGIVYYHASETVWENQLSDFIDEISKEML
jgi:DNA-binding NarL/FixJ family response regulator